MSYQYRINIVVCLLEILLTKLLWKLTSLPASRNNNNSFVNFPKESVQLVVSEIRSQWNKIKILHFSSNFIKTELINGIFTKVLRSSLEQYIT